MRRFSPSVCLTALVALMLCSASAAATPLVERLGGPAGFGAFSLEPGADSAYELPLAPLFPDGLYVGGDLVRTLWVNTNGTTSVGEPTAALPTESRAATATVFAPTGRGSTPRNPTPARTKGATGCMSRETLPESSWW